MGSQILQWIEFTVGVVGLIFGIFEHFKRQKIERVLRTITQTYPGDVAKIEQSCVWAWANAENVLRKTGTIPTSPEKDEMVFLLSRATSDATASARMCAVLFNQLLAFQEAQFGTRKISHPERDILDLCKAEARSANLK